MSRLMILTLIATAFVAAHVSATSEPGAVARPVHDDLSGVWTLDAQHSDSGDALQAALQRGGPSAGGEHTGGRTRRPAGGRGGRRGGAGTVATASGGDPRMPAMHEAAVLAAAVLDIEHEDPSLLVVFDGRQRRRLFTDNRGTSVSTSAPKAVSTAGWESGRLYVETTTDAGMRVIERYTLLDDGTLLEVQVTVMRSQFTDPTVLTRRFRRDDDRAQNARLAGAPLLEKN